MLAMLALGIIAAIVVRRADVSIGSQGVNSWGDLKDRGVAGSGRFRPWR
jgi:hypothetical protein